jgi:2-amino-4-hydroxy-6-hydroxymethyldihydropteridine diphosphokinase
MIGGTLTIERLALGILRLYLHPTDLIHDQNCFLNLEISFSEGSLEGVLIKDRLDESSICYSTLARDVLSFIDHDIREGAAMSVSNFVSKLEGFLVQQYPSFLTTAQLRVQLELTKALPYCSTFLYESIRMSQKKYLIIRRLSSPCEIGLKTWEHGRPQPMTLDVRAELPAGMTDFPIDYFHRKTQEYLAKNTAKTLEKFTVALGTYLCQLFGFASATLCAHKLLGVRQAESVSFTHEAHFESHGTCVMKHRKLLDELGPFEHDDTSRESHSCKNGSKKLYQYYIALGSNLDDRKRLIERAVRQLELQPEVTLLNTSFMYESAAMYEEDQCAFLNCAILVETPLDPSALLNVTQSVEAEIGRAKTRQNGPRRIDIDIIYCRSDEFSQLHLPTLILPHPRFRERAFVLRPILDMEPMVNALVY